MDIDSPAVSRRSLLVKGGAATALVWSAPAVLSVSAAHAGVGSPPPGTGGGPTPPPVRVLVPQTPISLRSTALADAADGLVRIAGGGAATGVSTVQATRYTPLPGTTFVYSGATSTAPSVVFEVSFTLPAAGVPFDNVRLSGKAQGDGRISAVRLNDVDLGASQPVLTPSTPNHNGSNPLSLLVVDPARFTSGRNTLLITVVPSAGTATGLGVGALTHALNLDATVTYNA